MADAVNIPWNLANTGEDFNTYDNKAALQGVEVKKAAGGLSALQGVDLNDPQSVGNAISNSVKSGNLEQATSLMGLQQNSTAFKNIFPIVQQKLAQYGQQQQSSAAPAGPATGAQPASPQDGHAADSMNMAAAGLSKLKDVPTDQRDQAIADLGANLQQRGISQQAIQSASDYITSAPDKATQDARIDELVSHYQGHADNFSGTASNTIEPHATTNSWSKQLMNDPVLNDPFVQGFLKKYGYDIEPQMGRAVQMEMPGITEAAHAAYAGPIAQAQENAKFPYTAATEAIKAHFEATNKPINLYPPGSTQPQTVSVDQWQKNPNVYAGWSTEPEVGSKAHAEASGAASGALEGNYGRPVTKPDAANLDQEQTNLTEASKAATGRLNSHVYDDNSLTAKQIVNLGTAVNSGAYTKQLSEVAQKLAPLMPGTDISQFANKSELLSQNLAKATKTQFEGSTLPRIASEFNTITKAVPTNVSPGDSVKLYGALMYGKNALDKDADSHITNYQLNPIGGNRSYTAAVNDFTSKRPDLLAYALPELRGMTINGQPAVKEYKLNDGRIAGVFMPDAKTGKGTNFYIGRWK